jgi:hypothetical protein
MEEDNAKALKKIAGGFGKFLMGLVLNAAFAVIGAKFWLWFVMPVFAVKAISPVMLYGLSFFVDLFRRVTQHPADFVVTMRMSEKEKSDLSLNNWFIRVMFLTVLFIFGAVFHLLFPVVG